MEMMTIVYNWEADTLYDCAIPDIGACFEIHHGASSRKEASWLGGIYLERI